MGLELVLDGNGDDGSSWASCHFLLHRTDVMVVDFLVLIVDFAALQDWLGREGQEGRWSLNGCREGTVAKVCVSFMWFY